MKLSWSQGTTGGDYLPPSASMHDNNEKLTFTFPKEQPTDAETGWEKLESWRSHEKRQPFKKMLHWILVLISLGMQRRPSPWICLHPGQFGNGEKCQEWVWQGASHSANALPCSRAGRALGLANTAGDELQVTIYSSLHCVQLHSPHTAAVMDRDCQSGVPPDCHRALRNTSSLISCFCPRKKSDDWSYFPPWGTLLFKSSFTLTFPPTVLVAYQKIKAQMENRKRNLKQLQPWTSHPPLPTQIPGHSLLV